MSTSLHSAGSYKEEVPEQKYLKFQGRMSFFFKKTKQNTHTHHRVSNWICCHDFVEPTHFFWPFATKKKIALLPCNRQNPTALKHKYWARSLETSAYREWIEPFPYEVWLVKSIGLVVPLCIRVKASDYDCNTAVTCLFWLTDMAKRNEAIINIINCLFLLSHIKMSDKKYLYWLIYTWDAK